MLGSDRINGNVAGAQGGELGGFAQGGGIFNGEVLGGATLLLTLDGTAVTGNELTGTAGDPSAGGGIHTVGFPITLRDSRVARNTPDDCSGC